MDRFSLTFRRRDTEREYVRWAIERDVRKLDFFFLCICVGICSVASVRFALAAIAWHHILAMAFGAAQFAWAAIVWRRMGTEELTTRRTAMVLRTRILMLLIACVLDIGDSPMPIRSLLHMCLCDGVFDSVLLAWGLRLKFQHHFPYQVVSTLAMVFMARNSQCTKLMDASGATSAWFVASKLDYGAKSIMVSMYGQCSNEPLICPCLHVMVWLHVFGVLILKTYMLRKVEWKSRRSFIQTLPQQRRRDEGLAAGPDDIWYMNLMDVFLFVVAFAITWDVVQIVANAINRWGM